jgi:hypothetical protein
VFRRKLKVKVFANKGRAQVMLVRGSMPLIHESIHIGFVELDSDEAEEQLAEVRRKARDLCKDLNNLEKS